MKHFLLIFTAVLIIQTAVAQINDTLKSESFTFTEKISLVASPVKDQYSSGTCWSFATTSFIESELARINGKIYDISEMYFVRKAYEAKAQQYVRLHGTANFGQGGQAHDVMNAIRKHGILLEENYNGLANGQKKPEHSELEAVLTAVVGAVSKNAGGKLSPEWNKIITSILDVYLGKLPENKMSEELELSASVKPEDYVEITSYIHHPFYEKFALEIPDNWSVGTYYNVPLDDLIRIIDYSLSEGYTVCWDGDVSDKGFSHQKGLALLPETNLENLPPTEQSKWEKLSEKDRKQQLFAFEKPVAERKITPEIRQTAFDNYSATDDHLMHITGTVIDQNGLRYFKTKNSWSVDSNKLGGFLYISEAYARLYTIAIMVHKNAIPKELKKKMGLN